MGVQNQILERELADTSSSHALNPRRTTTHSLEIAHPNIPAEVVRTNAHVRVHQGQLQVQVPVPKRLMVPVRVFSIAETPIHRSSMPMTPLHSLL